MNCEEFWNTAPARDLSGAHEAHLRDCSVCAGQWQAEEKLSAGLRAMAGMSKSVEAPARVEFRLVQAFRRHNGLIPTRRLPPARQPWLAALAWTAVAAALAIGLLLVKTPPPQQQAKPGRAPITQLAVTTPYEDATFANDGSDVDAGYGDVVRVEVPRSAMIALGYDVSPERAGERVEAEVTLGLDGRPKEVRFLEE